MCNSDSLRISYFPAADKQIESQVVHPTGEQHIAVLKQKRN